jgi:hypothetical protein
MTYLETIFGAVKKPYRRMYVKRRDSSGDYETTWQRVDIRDGISRVNSWGTVEFSVDAEKVIINSWDVAQVQIAMANPDGWFNSGSDSRSFWFGYLDHKDTKLKIDVGIYDKDGDILGETTLFEGLIISGENTSDVSTAFTVADYSKKLDEISFAGMVADGTYDVSDILDVIEADSDVTTYFNTINFDPKRDVEITVDADDNDIWRDSIWQVLQYLATVSMSTISVVGDSINLIARDALEGERVFWTSDGEIFTTSDDEEFVVVADGDTDLVIYGVGSQSPYNNLTLYGSVKLDRGGADKLYTTIIEKSTGSKVQSVSPSLLIEGRTKEIDLSDLTTSGDKTDVINDFLARFGVKRPTIQFSCAFLGGLIYPFSIVAVDNEGRQLLSDDVFVWDVSLWDSGNKWGEKQGSNKTYQTEQFIVERVSYNLDDWFSTVFGRMKNSL